MKPPRSRLASLGLLLLALTACNKDLATAPATQRAVAPHIPALATYETVRTLLVPRSSLRPIGENESITTTCLLRDVTGEPIPLHGRLETPGHCYYNLVITTNTITGEFLGQEIENYHCVPAPTAKAK